MTRAMLKSMTLAATLVALSGCATFREHKGAVIDQQLAASIQPGVDNKESVQKILGTPTLAGEFTANDWYYVTQDRTRLAFRDPHIDRHEVLHVQFDQAGNVTAIGETGKSAVMNVSVSNRVTPTLGRNKGFFDELFGNIGTFNSGALPGQ
jgi:outer membrane protein assembly factor BamE (lipoprotein component of BamABCDE complex)